MVDLVRNAVEGDEPFECECDERVYRFAGLGLSLPFSGAIELPLESALEPWSLVAFARGAADTRPLFAAFSGAAFFLFLSVRVLESRRWLPSADA